jgi:hypothetical protein
MFAMAGPDAPAAGITPAASPAATSIASIPSISPIPSIPSAAPTAIYTITLLAGSPDAGGAGFADGPGTAARFDYPTAIAYSEPLRTLYIADTANSTIRQLTITGSGAVATATVTTLAGSPGPAALSDATGAAARLNTPEALVIDEAGLLYIADTGNNLIRVLDPVTKTLATILTPDAGAGPAAPSLPAGIALAPDGAIIVVDALHAALLTLDAAPVFITEPSPRTVAVGTSVTLDATAWASPTPAYQWRKNNAVIATATTALYEIPAATAAAAATYTIAAANSAGATTSAYQLTITATTGTTGPSGSGSGGGGGGAPMPPVLALLAALFAMRTSRRK